MSKDNPSKQHHMTAPSSRPIVDEKAEDKVVTRQREQDKQSALHNYSVQDKRKAADIVHTNGSTPRRDL